VTPEEALEQLCGEQAWEKSPLDYRDEDQVSRSIVLDGERWAFLLRRLP
jgi:hypothetical protein